MPSLINSQTIIILLSDMSYIPVSDWLFSEENIDAKT